MSEELDYENVSAEQAEARANELIRQTLYVDHDLIEDYIALAVEWRAYAREIRQRSRAPK